MITKQQKQKKEKDKGLAKRSQKTSREPSSQKASLLGWHLLLPSTSGTYLVMRFILICCCMLLKMGLPVLSRTINNLI